MRVDLFLRYLNIYFATQFPILVNFIEFERLKRIYAAHDNRLAETSLGAHPQLMTAQTKIYVSGTLYVRCDRLSQCTNVASALAMAL